jgi:23S rRNA pseudouridine1911/1915/1917 synthase
MLKIKITYEFIGISPIGFLKKKVDISYFQLSKLVENGLITINDKKIKKGYRFKLNDEVVINSSGVKLREEFLDFSKKDLGINTIYEDEDFVVLNKLPDIVVQTGCENKNSVNWHLNFIKHKNCDNSNFKYTNCHRIDKNTSGVLVCAKNQKTLRDINEIFRNRDIKKKYICLVIGKPKKDSGEVEIYLERTPEGVFPKVVVSLDESENKTKRITKSVYKIIKTFKKGEDLFSLVEVEIKTGYTHQIRVHMKYLGCPIFGDKMYGNNEVNNKYEHILNRQFLHAKNINFSYKNKDYNFIAPLTKDLKDF